MLLSARAIVPVMTGLLGTALLRGQTTNAPFNFGSVATHAQSVSTLSFSTSNGPLTLSLSYGNNAGLINASNSDFNLGAVSCSSGACSVPVSFSPSQAGIRRASVSAFLRGTLQSVTPLSGIGIGPQISVGPGRITTIASRTNLQLATSQMSGVAARTFNSIYAADSANHRVFWIQPFFSSSLDNQISIIAGTGTPGFSGDGSLATSAQLNQPSGLALDNSGNLLIADTGNHRLRRLDFNTGLLTTVAGNGTAGFAGDGGSAVTAELNSPSAVSVLSNGDILISDTLNSRVRVVSAATGAINTLAGNGTAGFSGDSGVATSAQLNLPAGLAVDAADAVFIADAGNAIVRKVSGGIINTVAGQGQMPGFAGDGNSATAALLSSPMGLAIDAAGDLYIGDDGNNIIRKVTGDATQTISTIAGTASVGYSGDGGSALSARLNGPTSLTFDDLGNLYFLDSGNFALRSIGVDPAPVSFPLTLVGSPSSATIFVSNTGNQTLNIGAFSYSVSRSTPAFGFSAGGSCGATPTLTPGQSCTSVLSFTPTPAGASSGVVVLTSNSGNAPSAIQPVFVSQSNGLYFVPVTPCRVVDTRNSAGLFGSPSLIGQQSRDFAIRNSPNCVNTIPAGADVQAYSVNVTVVPQGRLDFLTVYPTAASLPPVSTLNSYDGRTKANAAIIAANMADNDRSISVYATDNTDLILDINGYFVPQATPNALAYYPVPPCRAFDTRLPGGPGGQVMTAEETRNFAVAGTCNIPTSAQAYALNFTAIPQNHRALPWITTWAAGQSQPIASTLNAPTGAVTANAALVPAGSSGNISIYAKAATDIIIDVSGYYAPLNSAPSGLALHPLTPCRAYDSRPRFVISNLPIQVYCQGSQPTYASQSFLLNATVTNGFAPMTSFGYLTLWARGSTQPLQSTLDAYDGVTTSNLAIVPTSDGFITAFASTQPSLILDLFGYFAP